MSLMPVTHTLDPPCFQPRLCKHGAQQANSMPSHLFIPCPRVPSHAAGACWVYKTVRRNSFPQGTPPPVGDRDSGKMQWPPSHKETILAGLLKTCRGFLEAEP